MLLPNNDIAYIPLLKLTGYLLSETHTIGKTKARIFRAHGFHNDNVAILEAALLKVIHENPVAEKTRTRFGTKYVIDGMIDTPRDTRVPIRTVWIVALGDERPKFVTAYPI